MVKLSDEKFDALVERMKKEPRIRKIVRDAQVFGTLRENEAWRALFEHVKSNRDSFTKALGRRFMSGEKVSPEEVAFHRGFYKGALWIISHPEMAEKSLERAARLAWTLAQEETDEGSE